MNGSAEQILKHTLLYSFVVSQPFAVYVDAYPALQNKWLQKENSELQYGKHSDAVRLLQHKLNQLSYYPDPIDGDFDIITEHALKKFQKDFDIDVTGQADPNTVHVIIQAEKKKMLAKIEELTESINIHQHDENIKTVQEMLNYFGYYEGEVDGIYGPLTEKALEVAEEEHDIELTDNITREAMVELYEAEEETENEDVETEANNEDESNENVDTEEVTDEASETVEEGEQEATQEIKTAEVESFDQTDIIQTAQSVVGTPYVWGGDSPGGFDCSGFINYIFAENNITVPRTVSEIWNFGQHVDSPSVGDLVFFETYQPGPSHMGIYVGNNQFIHAGESRGVETSDLNNPYWQEKYLGAKRIKN